MTRRSSLVAAPCVAALLFASSCGRQKDPDRSGPAADRGGGRKGDNKTATPSENTAAKGGKKDSDRTGSQSNGAVLPKGETQPTSSEGSVATQPSIVGGAAGASDVGPTPTPKAAPQLSIPLAKPLVDPIHDVHVRGSDGAFVAIGVSGTAWISKDNGTTWKATCSLPITKRVNRTEILLSSDESDHVLALSRNLYVVDSAVDNAGPCPVVPLPPDTTQHQKVVVSKRRIFSKSGFRLFISDNLGKSWLPVPLELPSGSTANISTGIAIDPSDPQRIAFASCEITGAPGTSPGRWLTIHSRSSDSAALSLQSSSVFCPNHLAEIAYERGKPGLVYYRTPGIPFVSGDGGKTWSKTEDFPYFAASIPEGGFANVDVAPANVAGKALATFKISPGGVKGVFSQKATFEVTDGTVYQPLLRGAKGRFVYSYGDALYASVDGGTTFKSIARPAFQAFAPVEVASRDGKTLWAIDKNWRVAMSPDGGASWSLRFAGMTAIESRPKHPRIYVHPHNDSTLVLREESFKSSGPDLRLATTNGFLTTDVRNDWNFAAPVTAVGFLASDAEAHYALNGSAWKGTATAAPTTPLPLPPSGAQVWSPFPDMLSLPSAPNVLFFGANGPSGGPTLRYEAYNVVNGAKRDILPALGMTPAGHAVVYTPQGVKIRVISETGRMRESSDGLAFLDVGPNPSLPACERRLLAVSRANPARMATACLGSSEHGVSLTNNNGLDWAHTPASDIQDCNVTQIVATESKVFASCSGSQKVLEIPR